jgi:hypothetical protein
MPFLVCQIRGSCGRCLPALVSAAFLAAFSSCGKSEGDDFLPVAGTVKLEGELLSVGAVSFRPDASKGNKSLHIPTGEINPQGSYELVTIGRKGAPAGWYKVLVYADANALIDGNSSRPPTPKWMMHEKYTEEGTTPLSIEVVEKPTPGAYDLSVTR